MKKSDIVFFLKFIDSDTSKRIRQIWTTIALIGCILIVLSTFLPWFKLQAGYGLLEDIKSRLLTVQLGKTLIVVEGAALGALYLRSLIKKKIDWVYAFLLSIICYATYTALYFMLKSIVSDTNVVYVPIISGFSLCMAGLLLVLISGIFAQVFGKEKETPKKQYKPYSRKKKKPHKRKK